MRLPPIISWHFSFSRREHQSQRNKSRKVEAASRSLCMARTFRVGPSQTSSRLSVRKDFRSRVVSCAPGTAFFESNFDVRDAISTQRVCKFSRSIGVVVEVKKRGKTSLCSLSSYSFQGFSRVKEVVLCVRPPISCCRVSQDHGTILGVVLRVNTDSRILLDTVL